MRDVRSGKAITSEVDSIPAPKWKSYFGTSGNGAIALAGSVIRSVSGSLGARVYSRRFTKRYTGLGVSLSKPLGDGTY